MKRRTFLRQSARIAGATLAAPLSFAAAAALRRADLVLHGGHVYDGTGAPPVQANLFISGDRITALGPGPLPADAEVLDVSGLAVAPGFIDIHSHTNISLLVNPKAESKIRQGVTTEIVGQDGGSMGPWTNSNHEAIALIYQERFGIEIDFQDVAGFFDRVRRTPGSVNIGSMIGAGTIRETVIGTTDRPASAGELEQMVGLVETALRAGACGLSTGLEYIPGTFASADELIALCAPLREWDLPYASHMRNEDDQLLAAIEEALHIGKQANVPVQIAHLKAQGQRNWWKAEAALQLIEQAWADGQDVTFDRYPYIAYSTGLGSLFPTWAREGGTSAFLERLQDPEQHPRIEAAVRAKIAKLGNWNAVQITSMGNETLKWAEGKRLGTLAQERSIEPYALLYQLTVEDNNRGDMVGFGMSEANTARFLKHPLGMICSDGGARAPYGPMSEGTPHPRTYGTFPRVLGHYSRDQKLMPLETAIYKMTHQPAKRLRFLDRGILRPGAYADVVVFDPATVNDQATFADPHQYPTGIPHVIVNGTFAVRDGEHTGATPGRVVRPG